MLRVCIRVAVILSMVCAGSAYADDSGLVGGQRAAAQPSPVVSYDGHKVVMVDVESQADLDLLMSITPDAWTDYPGVYPFPVRIPPDRMSALEASGLRYEVLIDDLGPASRRHLEPTVSRSDWDHYMDLDEIVSYINAMETNYPTLCEVYSIGTSLQSRDIWVLHISGTPSGSKPAVFYHSLIHCREWITAPVVLYLANYLVSNYGSDPDVTELVDGVDIYLAPCVNPDGYVYTWTTARYWRKNRRNNGDGSYGVDLNRNWGYEWGYDNYGSSPYTSDETYRGPSAFSEPETQVLSSFISSDPNILAYMDYHSFSQLILWPWGYDCLGGPDEPDATIFDNLGTTMHNDIQGVHGKIYDAGPICETIYAANGGSVDWAYGAEGRKGFTIELRPSTGGLEGFSPPASEILPTCEENLPALLHLTEWAHDQVGTTISFPNGLPDALTPGTAEAFDVEVVPLYQNVVANSPTLYYRYDGGTYQTAPLVHQSGNLYTATLPAANCSDTPEYYFSAEGDVSGVVYSPADAPTSVYSTAVGEFSVIFDDNFETDTGWTTENLGATSGDWERGTPVSSPTWDYDPESDSDGSGQCYVTENYAGNSDVDGGAVRLVSPIIDMSGGGATISYDYFLYLTNTTGAVDMLLVEIDSNGGLGPWTEIARHTTNGGLNWRSHTITQDDLDTAGVTMNSTMRLRFTANDADPQSVVEAGLDAFMVASFSCADPYDAGDLNCDGAVNNFDIDPFVLVITSTPPSYPEYYAAYPACNHMLADCNADGTVNNFDIDAFVGLLN